MSLREIIPSCVPCTVCMSRLLVIIFFSIAACVSTTLSAHGKDNLIRASSAGNITANCMDEEADFLGHLDLDFHFLEAAHQDVALPVDNSRLLQLEFAC